MSGLQVQTLKATSLDKDNLRPDYIKHDKKPKTDYKDILGIKENQFEYREVHNLVQQGCSFLKVTDLQE